MPQTSVKQALLVLVATLALGVGLGWAMGRSAASPASRCEEVLSLLEGQHALLEALPARLAAQASTQQVRCAVATPGAEADATALRAELAQLREALGQKPGGTQPPPPGPAPEPPPQAIAAQRQGHQLIEAATRSGQWREEDAQALRQLLIDMNAAQRQEVMQRLIVQLNSGTVKAQTQGPPF